MRLPSKKSNQNQWHESLPRNFLSWCGWRIPTVLSVGMGVGYQGMIITALP